MGLKGFETSLIQSSSYFFDVKTTVDPSNEQIPPIYKGRSSSQDPIGNKMAIAKEIIDVT